jgi:outer membrane protein assembly factor BamB
MKAIQLLVPAFCLVAMAEAPPSVYITKVNNSRKDHKKIVYCLDLASGKHVWEKQLPSVVNFAKQVSTGVLVGSDDGAVFLLDLANGEVLWTYRTGNIGDCINQFQRETETGYLISDGDQTHWLLGKDGQLVWVQR